MQDDITRCIERALDDVTDSERRPATFTRLAQTISDHCRANYKGRIWQCVVGTPGQLGFNVACSKDTVYKVVIDGIEVTLFYPKL